MNNSASRKNPSRELCEKTIRRILNTELAETGANTHFRHASDFMGYFESLYPPSDALTKQVQRAVKSMKLAKDENGYFIISKTAEQQEQDLAIADLFSDAHVTVDAMDNCEPVFLACDTPMREYLIHILSTSETFQGCFLTMVPALHGIVIYTTKKPTLLEKLNSLTIHL